MPQVLALAITMSAAAVIALAIAYFIIANGARFRLVQAPNHRSSHSRPTPSGAGIGIAVSAAICLPPYVADMSTAAITILLVSLVGAIVGLLDDKFDIPAKHRLVAHFVLTGIVIYVVFSSAILSSNLPVYVTGISFALIVFAAIWWINLFNFMDGIDGLCATESIFILMAVSYFLNANAADGEILKTITLTAAAGCGGFLLLNWPPARVFMGDSGSNFLAFLILGVALTSISLGYITVSTWLILPSLFISDSSITLIRRVLRGEKWYAAHKLHAYQKLSRRWHGHLPVTILFFGINVAWVFPLAIATQYFPLWEWQLTGLCYLLPVLLFWKVGAGLPDNLPPNRQLPL